MNQVHLVGRVTKDIELKVSAGGTKYVQFVLAVSSGKTKTVTNFIDMLAFSKQAEVLSQYAPKGTQICVEGRLNDAQYIDHEGNKRNTLKVVVEGFEFTDKNKRVTQEVAATKEK